MANRYYTIRRLVARQARGRVRGVRVWVVVASTDDLETAKETAREMPSGTAVFAGRVMVWEKK